MDAKKERQKFEELANSIKRGDKVMTTSGVYGTVVDLHMEEDRKIVTIETGMGKTKGYMAFDIYAIYTIFPETSKGESVEAVSQDAEIAQSGKEENN